MEKWQDLVLQRMKKGNAVLFRQQDSLFMELEDLVGKANHKAIVLWVLALCEEAERRVIEIAAEEQRGRLAIDQCALWAAGFIKMPVAKRAILDCHAIAKDTDDKELIALAHAIAQGCSCVHTPKHAMGFPVYDLTALVRRSGFCAAEVMDRIGYYIDMLNKAIADEQIYEGPWADFFMDPVKQPGKSCL